MNLATLRLEGTDNALQSARNTLDLVPDSTWERGKPKRHGGFFSSSGLCATIADAKNPAELVVAIREFAAKCNAQSFVFSSSGLSAELSVGVTVGDTMQFVASVVFSTSDLLSLGALGLDLSVTAYPTSNETNEATQNA